VGSKCSQCTECSRSIHRLTCSDLMSSLSALESLGPTNHQNLGPTHAAYHGLVRGIVQVSKHSAGPAWHRRRLLQIDADPSPRTHIQDPDADASDNASDAAIVVEATSPGLKSATISIPLSSELAASVLETAASNVLRAYVHDSSP
jgi:hypothetical protein